MGVCVAGLDADCMERGLACAPGSVPTFRVAVAAVEKIRFHSGALPSRGRVHVTVGHTTQARGRSMLCMEGVLGCFELLSCIIERW